MEQFKTISDVSFSSPYLLKRCVVCDSRFNEMHQWPMSQRSETMRVKTQTVCNCIFI